MYRMSEEYFIIIKTGSCSGNFEREIVAYITGVALHRGEEMASLAEKELDPEVLQYFEDQVVIRNYDNDYEDTCSIYPDEDFVCTGMGGIYPREWLDDPEKVKIMGEEYIKAQEDWTLPNIKGTQAILERLEKGESVNGWTIEDAKRDIADGEETIKEAREKAERGELFRYPGYTSIIFQLHEKPSPKIIEIIKTRARYFCDHFPELEKYTDGNPIEFRGLELLVEKTKGTKISL